MNKALISAVSIALSAGFIAPAFAYFPNPNFVKPSHRLQVESIKASKDILSYYPTRRHIRSDRNRSILLERALNNRSTSVTSTSTKATHLERTVRNYKGMRNINRRPKTGYDRYRVLQPNTRYFRRQLEVSSSLPPVFVRTGGYDKPTKRDIRGDNGDFFRVNGRDRDILNEVRENSR